MAGSMLQSINGKLEPGHDWELVVTDEFANPLYLLVISAEKHR